MGTEWVLEVKFTSYSGFSAELPLNYNDIEDNFATKPNKQKYLP